MRGHEWLLAIIVCGAASLTDSAPNLQSCQQSISTSQLFPTINAVGGGAAFCLQPHIGGRYDKGPHHAQSPFANLAAGSCSSTRPACVSLAASSFGGVGVAGN
eukprot:2964082-Rhodomonas_salina.1